MDDEAGAEYDELVDYDEQYAADDGDDDALSFGGEDEEDDDGDHQVAYQSQPAQAMPATTAEPVASKQLEEQKPQAAKNRIEFPEAMAAKQGDSTQQAGDNKGNNAAKPLNARERRQQARQNKRAGKNVDEHGQGMHQMGNGFFRGMSGPMQPGLMPFGAGSGPMMMQGAPGRPPGMGMPPMGMRPTPPPHPPPRPPSMPPGPVPPRPTPPTIPPPMGPKWAGSSSFTAPSLPMPPQGQLPPPPMLSSMQPPVPQANSSQNPLNPTLMPPSLPLGGVAGTLGAGSIQGKKSLLRSMMEDVPKAGLQQPMDLMRPRMTPAMLGMGMMGAARPMVLKRPLGVGSTISSLLSKSGGDVLKPQPQASTWVRPELAASLEPRDGISSGVAASQAAAALKPAAAVRKPTISSLPLPTAELNPIPKASKWINPDIAKGHVSLAHGMSIPPGPPASAAAAQPAARSNPAQKTEDELLKMRLELEEQKRELARKQEEAAKQLEELNRQKQVQLVQQTLVQHLAENVMDPSFRNAGLKRPRDAEHRGRSRRVDSDDEYWDDRGRASPARYRSGSPERRARDDDRDYDGRRDDGYGRSKPDWSRQGKGSDDGYDQRRFKGPRHDSWEEEGAPRGPNKHRRTDEYEGSYQREGYDRDYDYDAPPHGGGGRGGGHQARGNRGGRAGQWGGRGRGGARERQGWNDSGHGDDRNRPGPQGDSWGNARQGSRKAGHDGYDGGYEKDGDWSLHNAPDDNYGSRPSGPRKDAQQPNGRHGNQHPEPADDYPSSPPPPPPKHNGQNQRNRGWQQEHGRDGGEANRKHQPPHGRGKQGDNGERGPAGRGRREPSAERPREGKASREVRMEEAEDEPRSSAAITDAIRKRAERFGLPLPGPGSQPTDKQNKGFETWQNGGGGKRNNGKRGQRGGRR